MSQKEWDTKKLFDRLLKNKTKKTYWEKVRELQTRATQDVFDKCVELIQSSHAKERIIGVDVLAQLGLPPRPFLKETLKLYFEILKTEKEEAVIGSILFAIGHNHELLNKSQIEMVASFKKHTASFVREGVMFALLGINRQIAIDTLIYLMDDKVAYIRNWATFGIGDLIEKNNETIVTALRKRIHDKNSETRGEAILGLAKRKIAGIENVIKQELLHENHNSLLFKAIEEINGIQLLPLLKKNLKQSQQDKRVNALWIEDLQDCIQQLSKYKKLQK